MIPLSIADPQANARNASKAKGRGRAPWLKSWQAASGIQNSGRVDFHSCVLLWMCGGGGGVRPGSRFGKLLEEFKTGRVGFCFRLRVCTWTRRGCAHWVTTGKLLEEFKTQVALDSVK